MRVLSDSTFDVKLTAMPRADVESIASFVESVKGVSTSQIEAGELEDIVPLGESIYVRRFGQTTLFFSVGTDEEGEYALLLDVVGGRPSVVRPSYFAVKNPKTNSALNPRLNPAINPRLNSAINPRLNSAINPKLNSVINPKLNSVINPRLNAAINPRLNSVINPRLNSAINPRLNSTINPRLNRAFGGPFIYSVDLKQEGFAVRANDKVQVLFDLSGAPLGQLVVANDRVRVRFDSDSQWVGYAVSANEDVAVLFSDSGEWSGLLI